MGRDEQRVRIGLAGLLAAAAAFVPMPKLAKAGLFTGAMIGLATGITQYCPLSEAVGRNTCER